MARFQNLSLFVTLLIILHLPLVLSMYNVLFVLIPNFRSFFLKNSVFIPNTPNLNLFASNCVTFLNAFTQIPTSGPSRNSIFTSRRPDTLKCYGKTDIPDKFVTLPEYFERNGYETVSVGKVFPLELGENLNRKSQKWSQIPFWPPSAKFENESSCLYVDKKFRIKLVSNLVCPTFPNLQTHRYHPDEEITRVTLDYIKAFGKSNNTFFLTVGFFRPDIPYRFPFKFIKLNPLKNVRLPKIFIRPSGVPSVAWNPANKFKSYYDITEMKLPYPFGIIPANDTKVIKQSYFSSVSYVDNLLGQIFDELKFNNLSSKTIVVITGDLGCSLGERGLWGGHSCYDHAIKVPLLIYAPYFSNKIKFRKLSYELVELVDIFPTLVDLAGLNPLPKCPKNSTSIALCSEGISLYSVFESFSKSAISDEQKAIDHWKLGIFCQVPRPNIYPTKDVDSDEPQNCNITIMGYVLRTARFKLIEWVKFIDMEPDWSQVIARELYDFKIDPYEYLNLAERPQFTEIIDILRTILIRVCVSPADRIPWGFKPVTIGAYKGLYL